MCSETDQKDHMSSKTESVYINQIMETEQQFQEINKIQHSPRTLERFYYKRPTPIDVLFEENETFLQRGFSGTNIYEWNIDGYTDHQIYIVVHRMLMYTTVCKNNGNTDKNTASFLVCGFTGILQGWWDNYLSPEQRNEVLSAVKLENNQQREYVYTWS